MKEFAVAPIAKPKFGAYQRRSTMGDDAIGPRLRALGWVATGVMAANVLAMLATI